MQSAITPSVSTAAGRVPLVAAVHDLSCFGRCSLTVIIPTLTALGVQTVPLPTAILSTHLGGFSGMDICDFTEHLPAVFTHWQQEGIVFDGIYSGFLASERQIDVVSCFIDMFSANVPLVLVDPVMGDAGRLYSTCTLKLQQSMSRLVKKAAIITPNFTEACLLLGEEYQDPLPDSAVIDEYLRRLADLGPHSVVITGIPVSGGQLLNAGYDRISGTLLRDLHDYLPVRYPGTGDIYASVLLGSLLRGEDLASAMLRAAEFVALAINVTYGAGTPVREGVLLEQVLPALYESVKRP
jgi:pyridoxine kinase